MQLLYYYETLSFLNVLMHFSLYSAGIVFLFFPLKFDFSLYLLAPISCHWRLPRVISFSFARLRFLLWYKLCNVILPIRV